MSRASWSRKFPKPLKLINGSEIKSLSDARAYMLKLSKRHAAGQVWQHAAKLVLEAAEGGNIDDARRQMTFALLMQARLDVTAE
jgi:hypothetical protein